MHTYTNSKPRAIAGFAAAFMTVATLAVAIVAPAAMSSTSRDVSVATTSSAPQPAQAHPELTTTVDVVAVRSVRLVPVVNTRAQSRANVAS
jgi:hypothetical protein